MMATHSEDTEPAQDELHRMADSDTLLVPNVQGIISNVIQINSST